MVERTVDQLAIEKLTSSLLTRTDYADYAGNPIAFINDELGLKMWDKQEELTLSVRDNRYTIVEAGHSLGKSYSAAMLTCFWLSSYEESVVVTLAPTHAQVNNIIWRYIRYLGRKYKLPGEVFETPRWHIAPKRYAIGLSPKKGSQADAATLQGYHSPNLLVIMDEAPGIPRVLWDAVMSLPTSENSRILAIGNPIEQAGPFWDAANSPNWNKIRMSCLDHPNVTTGEEIIQGAVSRQWVEEMIRDHCVAASVEEDELDKRLEEVETEQEALAARESVSVTGAPGTFEWEGVTYLPNAVFESKVLGRPPQEGSDQLISLAWVEHARNWQNVVSGETVIGFDPARYGGDQAAMTLRIGGRVLWIKRRRPITKNPSFEWANWIQSEVKDLKSYWIMIDEIGIGAGTLDACRQMGLNVRGVGYSKKAFNYKKFSSIRDECWWNLREKLQKGEISLPDDDMLAGDLTAPKYGFDSLGGRIKIEEKEKTKGRLGRSPDSGDALAVTFGFPALSMWEGGSNPVQELKDAGGSRWFLATKPGGSRWSRKRRFSH